MATGHSERGRVPIGTSSGSSGRCQVDRRSYQADYIEIKFQGFLEKKILSTEYLVYYFRKELSWVCSQSSLNFQVKK